MLDSKSLMELVASVKHEEGQMSDSCQLSLEANGIAHFKKCKQLFEYQHLLLFRDIWWSKF
jgi:hypothetical protein